MYSASPCGSMGISPYSGVDTFFDDHMPVTPNREHSTRPLSRRAPSH